MERLTKRELGGITYNNSQGIMCSAYCDNCSQGTGNCDRVKAMVNRLAKLEDLEEQGLLVRLPCTVGDVAFHIDEEKENLFLISEVIVTQIHVTNGTFNIQAIHEKHGETLYIGCIGRSLFFTREEAEKKLEEMEKR